MNQPASFGKIFYPSDFSRESQTAFVHALKIALQSRAMLQMMHVDTRDQADWDDFPSVTGAMERWKVVPEGSGQEAIAGLGFEVSKVIASSPDPVKACLDFLEVHAVDLIVLSVQQREGMMRWMANMTSERISQGSGQTTLFLPAGREGFVSPADGSVKLDRILIPMVKKPRSESSVAFVQTLTRSLGLASGSVTLLHVGSTDTMPFIKHPFEDGWSWNRMRVEGDRCDTIVQVAREMEANLIVMTTDGPDRFLDGLRGTTSERVLRRAHCPVAVIPVESTVE